MTLPIHTPTSYVPYKSHHVTADAKHITVFYHYEQVVSEEMLNVSDEEVAQIEDNWKLTAKENDTIWKQNRQVRLNLIQETEDLFALIGLPTYKKSPRSGKVIGEHKEFKAILKAIDIKCGRFPRQMPFPHEIRVCGENYRSHKSPVTLTELVAMGKDHRRLKLEREQRSKADFAKAAALASTYGISLDDPDLYNKVVAADREAFREKNYPEGTDVDHSCCDTCSSWTVGDHRCSCGNRRMSLTIEGNIGNWYAYGEAN